MEKRRDIVIKNMPQSIKFFVNFSYVSTYQYGIKSALSEKTCTDCYKSYKNSTCNGFRYVIKYLHKLVKTLT